MPISSEQDLETWIASRKKNPTALLSKSVMDAIHSDTQAIPQETSTPKLPPWFVAFGCLLAGVGKLSLVFHLAF
jgi:hypothetical protein